MQLRIKPCGQRAPRRPAQPQPALPAAQGQSPPADPRGRAPLLLGRERQTRLAETFKQQILNIYLVPLPRLEPRRVWHRARRLIRQRWVRSVRRPPSGPDTLRSGAVWRGAGARPPPCVPEPGLGDP